MLSYLDILKLLWFMYESHIDWFIAADWFNCRWAIVCFWLYEVSITEFCSALNESKRLYSKWKTTVNWLIKWVSTRMDVFTCVGGPDAIPSWLNGAAFGKLCCAWFWCAEPNKLFCCIIDRLKSCVERIGDVGDDGAMNFILDIVNQWILHSKWVSLTKCQCSSFCWW